MWLENNVFVVPWKYYANRGALPDNRLREGDVWCACYMRSEREEVKILR